MTPQDARRAPCNTGEDAMNASKQVQTRARARASRRRALALVAAVAIGAGVLPGMAEAQAPSGIGLATYQGADRMQRLIEGAKKEGELSIYTSAPVDDVKVLTDAFEKKYGVKAKVWRASSEKVLQRGVTEARAGRFDADVFETNGPEMEALVREKILT